MTNTLDVLFDGDRQIKETWVLGLAFKCPRLDNNPCNCQINCIRKNIPSLDLIQYIKNLPDEDLNMILYNHAYCVNNKA